MNDPACCTETCVCRLGYPENRLEMKERLDDRGLLVSMYESPRAWDVAAAESWVKKWDNSMPSPVWQNAVTQVKYLYPGGWPAFIIEEIEK